MEKKKCCVEGCEEDAEYIDEMDNYYCDGCFEADMIWEDRTPEDYETINE